MSGLKVKLSIKKREEFNIESLPEAFEEGLAGTGYIIKNIQVSKDNSDLGRVLNTDLITFDVYSQSGFEAHQLFGGLQMARESLGTFEIESITHEDL